MDQQKLIPSRKVTFAPFRHAGEGRHPVIRELVPRPRLPEGRLRRNEVWIPACAGMTERVEITAMGTCYDSVKIGAAFTP